MLTSDLGESYIGSGPKLASVIMSEPWVYNGDKQMLVLVLGTVFLIWWCVSVLWGAQCECMLLYLAKKQRSIFGHEDCE